MSSSADPAPPGEHDPANTDAEQAHDRKNKEVKVRRPRDSKGWDGKLRVDKVSLNDDAASPGAEGESDAEQSEDEGPPPEQLAADEDLLDDVPEDEEEIDLVHFRVSNIPALKLERFQKLKVRSVAV